MIGHVGLADDAAGFNAAEQLGPDAFDRRLNIEAFRRRSLGANVT